jgi:hypothetical protein
LFYRVSSGLHLIDKTEPAYKNLCHHLAKWRRSGDIKWSAFSDNTRWWIKTDTFDDVHDALERTVRTYRKNLWKTQPYYVEVWVEKDAIAGIVSGTAAKFGVPVFVCRGYASLSGLSSAAETFRLAKESGKEVVIYHLGDYDPSGVDACEFVKRSLIQDFRVDLQVVRAAVTREQIERLKLPTRPAKKSDSRITNWNGDDCVELDTMPPREIQGIVEHCITQHIDTRAWETLKQTEAMERETLQSIFKKAVKKLQ